MSAGPCKCAVSAVYPEAWLVRLESVLLVVDYVCLLTSESLSMLHIATGKHFGYGPVQLEWCCEASLRQRVHSRHVRCVEHVDEAGGKRQVIYVCC